MTTFADGKFACRLLCSGACGDDDHGSEIGVADTGYPFLQNCGIGLKQRKTRAGFCKEYPVYEVILRRGNGARPADPYCGCGTATINSLTFPAW